MEEILSQWTSFKIQVPKHSNEACKLHNFIVWLSFQLCYPVEVCLQATTSPDYLMSKWQSCKTMVTFTCSIVVVTGWIRLWIVLQICIQNEMSERCKYEWWLVKGNPHVFFNPTFQYQLKKRFNEMIYLDCKAWLGGSQPRHGCFFHGFQTDMDIWTDLKRFQIRLSIMCVQESNVCKYVWQLLMNLRGKQI